MTCCDPWQKSRLRKRLIAYASRSKQTGFFGANERINLCCRHARCNALSQQSSRNEILKTRYPRVHWSNPPSTFRTSPRNVGSSPSQSPPVHFSLSAVAIIKSKTNCALSPKSSAVASHPIRVFRFMPSARVVRVSLCFLSSKRSHPSPSADDRTYRLPVRMRPSCFV